MKSPTIFTIVLSTIAVLVAAPAFAQTKWTMVSGYPEHSFFTKNIRLFIKEVENKTAGELEIKLFSNGSLVKMASIKRAVRSGQVQIGEIRLGIYSNDDRVYGLDNIPGLTSTYKTSWKLMKAQQVYFDKILPKKGLKIITYEPWPGQGFYTSQPVKSLQDLKGKKIRIYSKETKTMAQMLGMKPTILPFADIPQAFSTNLVSSMWTSAQSGTDVQAWDFTKCFTFTGSEHNKNAIIVNSQALHALDKKNQRIIIAAGKHATQRAWKMSKKDQKSTAHELKVHGMVLKKAPKDVIRRIDKIGKTMVASWRKTASNGQNAVLTRFYNQTKSQDNGDE